MRFAFLAAVLSALTCTSMAVDDSGYTTDFVPITSPKKGDVVPPGSTWDMSWSKGSDGVKSMVLMLYSGDGSDAPDISDLEQAQVVIHSIKTDAMHYMWNAPRDVSDDKWYYIIASGLDDRSKMSISDPFKISKNKDAGKKDGGSSTKTKTKTSGKKTKGTGTATTPPTVVSTTASATTTAPGDNAGGRVQANIMFALGAIAAGVHLV